MSRTGTAGESDFSRLTSALCALIGIFWTIGRRALCWRDGVLSKRRGKRCAERRVQRGSAGCGSLSYSASDGCGQKEEVDLSRNVGIGREVPYGEIEVDGSKGSG